MEIDVARSGLPNYRRHRANVYRQDRGYTGRRDQKSKGMWVWSGCDAVPFNRLSDGRLDQGMEKTARLAVQRAEEYFFALMPSPIRAKCRVKINNKWDPDNERPDQ